MLPTLLILVIVAGALIYLYRTEVKDLYRAEINALVFRSTKGADSDEAQKIVAEDWKHTGYIDFSAPQELRATPERHAEPHFIYLMVEEYRLIRTIGDGIAVERRWRRGSLTEARAVAQNYNQFLQEHPEKAFNEGPRKLTGSTIRLLDHSAA
jgi:hypothetical protein